MKPFILAALFALSATPSFAMDLKSSDVTQGATLAIAQVCARYDGQAISPALSWSGVPANAKSLAVTMFDPDAQAGKGFWHWTVLDIPASATAIAQGAGSGKAALPDGSRQGANGAGDDAYRGACPPAGSGVHHYEITLWALSEAKPAIAPNATAVEIGDYLTKNALDKARITPVYQK
ncbi:MAG TPA: YbhB/YbcL family Raf kinase inhibitor-like protein [Rhizomicrobium sp.]